MTAKQQKCEVEKLTDTKKQPKGAQYVNTTEIQNDFHNREKIWTIIIVIITFCSVLYYLASTYKCLRQKMYKKL